MSSQRADVENSRGPLCEATQDSEQTEHELGPRGPRDEVNLGLVDDKGTVAEEDCSTLATGGNSAAVPGTEETDTCRSSSERAAGVRGASAVEEESSNLANKSVPDVENTDKASTVNILEERRVTEAMEEEVGTLEGENSEGVEEKQEERQECEASARSEPPETEQKKRKLEEGTKKSEMSNGVSKRFKTSTDEEVTPVLKKYKLKEIDAGDLTNADDSVTEDVNKNGSGLSEERPTSELAVKEKMETSGKSLNYEGLEEEQEMEQDCEDVEGQSDRSVKMEAKGTETADTQRKPKKKRMSGAQKRKMRIMLALLAGERVLSKAERKKGKPEADTQKSETSNEVPKKSKTSTNSEEVPKKLTSSVNEGKAPAKQTRKLKEVKSGDSVNADDSNSMRLAVVPEDFPDVKMTEEQAEVLGSALVERINPSDKGEPVQFSAMEFQNGGLAFTCANKTTKVWLCSTVPKIVPWPKAKLTVEPADTTLQGTKFILWVIKGMNKRSNQQILDFLQRQNKEISTAEWKIIRRVVETDKRVRMTLWVDDKSSKDLKACNFKLFLGIYRVRFMLVSEWKKLTSSKNSKKQGGLRPSVGSKPRQSVVSNSADKDVPRSWVSSSTTDRWDSRSSDGWKPRASDKDKARASDKEKPRTSDKDKPRAPDEDKPRAPDEDKPRAPDEDKPRAPDEDKPRASGKDKPQASDKDKPRSSDKDKHSASPARDRRASLARDRRASPSRDRDRRASPSRDRDRRASPSRDRDRRASPSRDRDRRASPSRDRDRRASPSRDRDRRASPSRDRDRRTSRSRDRDRRTSRSRDRDRRAPRSRDRRAPRSRDRRAPRSRDRDRRTSRSRDRDRRTSRSRDRDRRTSRSRDRDRRTSRSRDRDRRASPAHDRRASPSRDRDRHASPTQDRDRRVSPDRDCRISPAWDRDRRVSPTRDRDYRDSRFHNRLESGSQECRASQEHHASPVVPDPPQISDMRYTASDLALAHSVGYQPHESGFSTSELLESREACYMISERAQPRQSTYASDGSQKNRYFTSDLRQPLERSYRAPDSPQLHEMRHTVSDLAPSRSSKYVSPSHEQAESPRFRHSGQLSSHVSRFSESDESLIETSLLKSLASKLLVSQEAHEHGFGMSELSQLREASSIGSDRPQRRESKHTPSRLQESRYFASDHRQPLKTGYGAPDPPQISEPRFLVSDQLSPQETRFTASKLTQSRDSRYVSPTQDQSKNTNLRSSDQPASRDSRFSDQGKSLKKSTVLQNVEYPFAASVQTLKHGFGKLELSEVREASSVTSDLAQRRGSRYSSDQAQENRYFASDHRQFLETGYGVPDPPQISETRLTVSNQMSPQKTKYMAPDQTMSYSSRYETPNKGQAKNSRLRSVGQPPPRVSRFRDMDENLKETATLPNFMSTFVTSEQPREHGFGTSEKTHLREFSYPILDQTKHRDSRYPSDPSQESKYITSDCRQPHETGHVAPDPLQLRGMKYKSSDQAPSRDPKSAIPNQDLSKNPRLRGSNESLSHGSRLRGLDKPSVQESGLRGSDQMQSKEGRYMERHPLHSRESGWRTSDPQQFSDVGKTDSPVSLTQKTRFSSPTFPPQK